MIAKVLTINKELYLPTNHSRVTQFNTVLGIRILQLLLRPQTSQVLANNISYRVRSARPRYPNLMFSNFEWKAKTAKTILSFNLWNTDVLNIPARAKCYYFDVRIEVSLPDI